MPAAVQNSAPAAKAPLPGVQITHVSPGSEAERLGITHGDRLTRLNGHDLSDMLDYWFHVAAERLKVEWLTGAGEVRSSTIRKPYHERLGVELEPFEIKRCSNHCVFCFVHQLPPGMRRELYLKDEDFRLSFLYGNYITGTNLSPADKQRIITQKLSPLYFSVHATDQAVRERLLVKQNIEPIVPLLKKLTEQNIFIHAQVVLCPGINDGKILEKTALDLADLYPKLESVAVVPLGLTDHRSRLPRLDYVTPEYAAKFVKNCARIQKLITAKIGYPLIFPSDEFYLIADQQPPSYDDFPEIPQLANGVGMYHRFYEDLEDLLNSLPEALPAPRRVAAITTHMGVKVLSRLVDAMNSRIANLKLELLPITNTLFGEGITVTGLLPGKDFESAITATTGFDRYLIPENALRSWDNRFLDNMTWNELQTRTKAEIVTGGDTAASFADAVLL